MIVAFFDLDLTVVKKDSFHQFIKFLYFKKLNIIWLPWLVYNVCLRKLRFIQLEDFKINILRPLVDYNKVEIKKLGDIFLDNYLLQFLNPTILAKIKWHKSKKHQLVLATSCPDIYLESICLKLGFHFYEGTKIEYKENRFTGRFQGSDILGEEKVKRITPLIKQLSIDLKKSYAYSDHESDLPLLYLVGNPLVVNPTKKLKEIAINKQWTIIQ